MSNTIENLSYEELINKIRNKALNPGVKYIISDYLTIYQSNHLVNGIYETWGYEGHVESQFWHLIITAISEDALDNKITILEHPEYAAEYDATLITFQDGVTNKGTITYLRDLYNNSAHYDFKNIRFRRVSSEYSGNYYTFSYRKDGLLQDNSETGEVYNNELGLKCWNNVFLGNTFNTTLGDNSCGNTFFGGCRNSYFYNESCNNTFFKPVIDLTGTLINTYVEQGAIINKRYGRN